MPQTAGCCGIRSHTPADWFHRGHSSQPPLCLHPTQLPGFSRQLTCHRLLDFLHLKLLGSPSPTFVSAHPFGSCSESIRTSGGELLFLPLNLEVYSRLYLAPRFLPPVRGRVPLGRPIVWRGSVEPRAGGPHLLRGRGLSGLPPLPDVTTGPDMCPSLLHPRKHSWPTSFGPTRTPFSSAVKHLTCAFLVSLPPTHFSPDSLETSASVTPLKQLLAAGVTGLCGARGRVAPDGSMPSAVYPQSHVAEYKWFPKRWTVMFTGGRAVTSVSYLYNMFLVLLKPKNRVKIIFT